MHPKPWTVRALTTATCLVTALSLSACGGSPVATSTSTATEQATSNDAGGAISDSTSTPGVPTAPSPSASPTPEAPPASNVKFYVEAATYLYRDDSVTNQDAVSSDGNLQGFRSNQGACVAYVKRDIESVAYGTTISDTSLTDQWGSGGSSNLQDFTETGRETVSLVRDDGGTAEGLNITYTATYTWAEGPSAVSGYQFTRVVGASGLVFSAFMMCKEGSDPGLEVWHQILSGIRLEGISAGTMAK